MPGRRLVLGLAAALTVALGAAGCGGDYSDLLLVERSGSLPGARLDLVINDGGTVVCARGQERQPLPPRLLLDARDVVRALRPQMEERLAYPRSPRALLRFRAVTADGEIAFNDVDAARDLELGRLIELTRRTARDVCGLAR